MRRQVYSLPALIRDEVWEIEARTRKAISTPQIFSMRTLVIAGSGDSYMAGKAAAGAFWQYAGILPHVQSSLEASRYTAPAVGVQLPNTPLVLAVSSSGEVARLVEAVMALNKQGALTVALTANPESRLGQAAQTCIPLRLPRFDAAPGVRSFVVSLLALQMLAIRFGEVRGHITMDRAMALRTQLAASADAVAETIERSDAACATLAQAWEELSAIEYLASGPLGGIAQYAAAKILEATGQYASAVDIEEWNHLNYFVGRPQEIGTLLFSGQGYGSQARALEVAGYLDHLGRPWATVGTMRLDAGVTHLPVECSLSESLAPLVYAAPAALLAAHLNELLQEPYGREGKEQWRDSRDGNAVRHSVISAEVLPQTAATASHQQAQESA
jgi:glucosamine--fructose-6-phosphate aminotransferase (isomerizing)